MDPQENKSPRLSNAILIGQLQPEHIAEIPFVSKEIVPAFIENGFGVIEYSYPYFLGSKNQVKITHKHIVYEAIDDSMKPSIKQGDKILGYFIGKEELESINEGMYILIFNDQLMMRRIRENTLSTNGTRLLYTDNDQLAPKVAFLGDISEVWNAIGSNVSVP
ncbi:S24 family peptidase [Larkinella rosea]|uniref:Peptidase S24/S26A/S26B/S26C domain-containing protein n=1 Tax=Larkinella rosea TaxID=2025312 RepID=A0A3P1BYY1_9BACT|nr:S24 family peptidase [Larkinella rosea]RRB06310.1 hypothetical protein EHT25_00450 [Larkinella rosea]